jgi:hypothetical protein
MHNALRAAAVRGLLDFIFAIRAHVHRPGITLPTNCPRIAAARLLWADNIFSLAIRTSRNYHSFF